MPATKTPQLKRTLRQLADLNDQFCYLAFVEEEFSLTLKEQEGGDDVYTTEAYPKNEKAPRIHVRLSELPTFSSRARSVTNGAFFTTSYEVAKEHLNRLLAEMEGDVTATDEPIEIRLAGAITSQSGGIEEKLVNALSYVRLRRNQFVHGSVRPTSEMKKLVKYRGPELNETWNTQSLDFGADPTPTLVDEESVDLLKIIRVCVEGADRIVAGLIDEGELLQRAHRLLEERKPQLAGGSDQPRVRRKLQGYLFHLYGFEASEEQIAAWLSESAGG